MALSGVAAYNHYQIRCLDVGDRARVASIANSSEQSGGRRRLTVTRTIVDVVRANHRPRQLLHEIAFFVCALRGRDERHGIRTTVCL